MQSFITPKMIDRASLLSCTYLRSAGERNREANAAGCPVPFSIW